jgi:hypothetical protein
MVRGAEVQIEEAQLDADQLSLRRFVLIACWRCDD